MDTQPVTRRALLTAAGTLGGAAALAACRRQQAAEPPKPARKAVTIRYIYDHTDVQETIGAWYRWMAERFADEFPGSRAEIQLVERLPELVTVSVAAGKPAADAIYLRLFEARELWDGGALTELTQFIRNYKELAPSNYFPVANDYRTAGGALFALPNYVNVEMVHVNSRMLQEAGLDPRAADLRTWEDLARYNQVLSKRNAEGKYIQLGYPMSSVAWQTLGSWVYANGGELQNPEVTKALFNSPQTEQVLFFWREMYQRYGNPALWDDSLRQPNVNLFRIEKSAIRDRSFGFARAERATPGWFPSGAESWVIPVPRGPSTKGPATAMWVNQMGVPRGVEHPDMAFELLRCGVDLKGQTVMHQKAQWEPSLTAYYQTQAFQDELRKDPLLQVGLEAFKTGRIYPFYRRYTTVTREPFAPLLAAIRGERDVRDALAEAERLTNLALGR